MTDNPNAAEFEGCDLSPVPLPIDGVLDLHTFRPSDVKGVVTDFLEACRERGILEVRVIHGRGVGELRRTVHTLLQRNPAVASFAQASVHCGGWGATIVHLHPCDASYTPR